MHAESRIFGKCKQRHRAHNRFWLERDVVVHEQHVSCPARFTKFDQAACKTAGATQVAVWDDRERCICRRIERHILSVINNEHLHFAIEGIRVAHQIEHIVHGLTHVFLAIKCGDRQ